MNEFVEECRTEWRRLGVPSPVIDDMAGELAADIAQAEAEGASAGDVLGAGAHSREFAAAWAAERGVIERSLPSEPESVWRSRTSAVIAALAVIAIAGAVLVIFVSPADSDRSGLPLPRVVPYGGRAWTVDGTASPLRVIVQDLGSEVPLVRTVEIGASDSSDSSDTRAAGSVMLFAALAGIMLLTMWVWAGPGLSPRRRRHVNGRSSGQG